MSKAADCTILLKLSGIRVFGFIIVNFLKLIFNCFLRLRLRVESETSFRSSKLCRSLALREETRWGYEITFESISLRKSRCSEDSFFFLFRKHLFARFLIIQFLSKRLINDSTYCLMNLLFFLIWFFDFSL